MKAPAKLAALLERLQQSRDPDARELAFRIAEAIEQPDRRVGAALQPRKRGGVSDWHAEQLAERNAGYRDFAIAEYGTALLTPKQARALSRKVRRLIDEVHFIEGGHSLQKDAARRIRTSGLGAVGPRQLLRILPEKNCDIRLPDSLSSSIVAAELTNPE